MALPAPAQVSLFDDEEARQKLAELEEELALLQGSVRKIAAEAVKLNNEKRELLELLRQLSGQLEETQLTSSRHDSRIDEINVLVTTEGNRLRDKMESGYEQVRSDLVSSDAELYARALALYERTDYVSAEKSFDELLLRFPASQYAPAAHYWLGLIQLDQTLLAGARETFSKLLVDHPGSSRVPDAIRQLEQIAILSGDLAAAEHWQRQLLQNHPTSAAADARRRELALGN